MLALVLKPNLQHTNVVKQQLMNHRALEYGRSYHPSMHNSQAFAVFREWVEVGKPVGVLIL